MFNEFSNQAGTSQSSTTRSMWDKSIVYGGIIAELLSKWHNVTGTTSVALLVVFPLEDLAT